MVVKVLGMLWSLLGIFTQIAEVIPIENMQPIELISALKLIFRSMGTLSNYTQMENQVLEQKCFF